MSDPYSAKMFSESRLENIWKVNAHFQDKLLIELDQLYTSMWNEAWLVAWGKRKSLVLLHIWIVPLEN